MNTALVERPPPRSEFLKRPFALSTEDLRRKSPEELKYYFPEVTPEEVQNQMAREHQEYYHPSNRGQAKKKLYNFLLDTTYKEKRAYEKFTQSIIKFEHNTEQEEDPVSPKPPQQKKSMGTGLGENLPVIGKVNQSGNSEKFSLESLGYTLQSPMKKYVKVYNSEALFPDIRLKEAIQCHQKGTIFSSKVLSSVINKNSGNDQRNRKGILRDFSLNRLSLRNEKVVSFSDLLESQEQSLDYESRIRYQPYISIETNNPKDEKQEERMDQSRMSLNGQLVEEDLSKVNQFLSHCEEEQTHFKQDTKLFKRKIKRLDSEVKELAEEVDFRLLNPFQKFIHEVQEEMLRTSQVSKNKHHQLKTFLQKQKDFWERQNQLRERKKEGKKRRVRRVVSKKELGVKGEELDEKFDRNSTKRLIVNAIHEEEKKRKRPKFLHL